MAKTNFRSVEEYLGAQPETARGILEKVRTAIRNAVPEADEVISYQMAGYKLDGRPLIYFGAWKQHFSIYPATRGMLAAFAAELAPYAVEKSTIRFPYARPPVKLIGRIAKFRLAETRRGTKDS